MHHRNAALQVVRLLLQESDDLRCACSIAHRVGLTLVDSQCPCCQILFFFQLPSPTQGESQIQRRRRVLVLRHARSGRLFNRCPLNPYFIIGQCVCLVSRQNIIRLDPDSRGRAYPRRVCKLQRSRP